MSTIFVLSCCSSLLIRSFAAAAIPLFLELIVPTGTMEELVVWMAGVHPPVAEWYTVWVRLSDKHLGSILLWRSGILFECGCRISTWARATGEVSSVAHGVGGGVNIFVDGIAIWEGGSSGSSSCTGVQHPDKLAKGMIGRLHSCIFKSSVLKNSWPDLCWSATVGRVALVRWRESLKYTVWSGNSEEPWASTSWTILCV